MICYFREKVVGANFLTIIMNLLMSFLYDKYKTVMSVITLRDNKKYYKVRWYRVHDALTFIILFLYREGGFMEYLITFIFCFVIVYLVYSTVVIFRKKGFEKFKTSKQLKFFEIAYKIDFKKINLKSFAQALALTNAFIIAFTCTVIEIFDSLIFKMLVGFVILVPLMLLMYKLLGTIYKKKEGK